MTDLWTVSEADLPHALAVASYVSHAQRAALDALPQWPGHPQGPSGAHVASQQRAAPPAADDGPQLQFMNAQDAPAFGDEPSDEGGGGGGGQALRATPTASPVAALFETQPRGGTAGGQAARGDSQLKSRHTSMTEQLTQALPQTQAPFDSQPEVGSDPVVPSPGGAAGGQQQQEQPKAQEKKAAEPPAKQPRLRKRPESVAVLDAQPGDGDLQVAKPPGGAGLAAVAEEAGEEAPPAAAKAKRGKAKAKAKKKAAKGAEREAVEAKEAATQAAPAPAPAPRLTSTPDVAAGVLLRSVRSSIQPGTQPPPVATAATPPEQAPPAPVPVPPAAPRMASLAAGPQPQAARAAAPFLAALGILDVAAEVQSAVKKQRR